MKDKPIHSIERIGWTIYPFRVFGFLLFGSSILISHWQSDTPIEHWVMIALAICLIYPHIVFLRYLKNESRQTEIQHMLIDMALLGMMASLVNFNPAVVLPYFITNSSANYALRGKKQAINGLILLVVPAVIAGLLRNEPISIAITPIELLCPFIYLTMTTHYMGYLAYVRGKALVRRKQKAEELAKIDFLTGLNNRRSMFEELELNDQDHSSITTTFIMIDLDHFKQINDNHGHSHGDAALIEVSRLIKETLRDGDVVARWGGEEFLVLLPNTATEKAIAIAQQIREEIAKKPLEHLGVTHSLTATLGIASYGEESNFDTAIQRADKALYDGKRQGRNRVIVA